MGVAGANSGKKRSPSSSSTSSSSSSSSSSQASRKKPKQTNHQVAQVRIDPGEEAQENLIAAKAEDSAKVVGCIRPLRQESSVAGVASVAQGETTAKKLDDNAKVTCRRGTHAMESAGSGGISVETFSGLRTNKWRLRPEKWASLMQGKRYVPFDRISSLGNIGESDKDCVVIGVLYEKGIAKTGSNGNRYVLWHFTDLAFPKPRVLGLFLFDQAFEAWGMEVDGEMRHGSVIALLNPVLLPTRSPPPSGEKSESREKIRVSYSTQLVILGECPSLGFCCWSKKDGMKCSMPCNVDRGPNTCFFHCMQKCSKSPFGQSGSGGQLRLGSLSQGGLPKPPSRAAEHGVSVLERKAGKGSAKGQQPSLDRSLAARSHGAHGAKKCQDKGDLAVQQLLHSDSKCIPPKRGHSNIMGKQAASLAVGLSVQCPPGAPPKSCNAPSVIPGSRTAERTQGQLGSTTGTMLQHPQLCKLDDGRALQQPPVPRMAAEPGSEEQARYVKRLMRQFPQGIPAPGPGGFIATPSVPVAVSGQKSSAPWLLTNPRHLEKRSKRVSDRASGLSSIALQAKTPVLPKADPRKDTVRLQQSRFANLVDEERTVKRQRMLGELEAQDAIKEKMEGLMSLEVAAWRCEECGVTSESTRLKEECENRFHTVRPCTATKTRWECITCAFSTNVLDRLLPDRCQNCGGVGWRPTPLQGKPKTALMEKDLFQPRGDEIKFVNSLPSSLKQAHGIQQPSRSDEEAKDPYDALNI